MHFPFPGTVVRSSPVTPKAQMKGAALHTTVYGRRMQQRLRKLLSLQVAHTQNAATCARASHTSMDGDGDGAWPRPNRPERFNAGGGRNNFSLQQVTGPREIPRSRALITACPRASRPRTTTAGANAACHPPNPGPSQPRG
jgi:hypothetical protein